MRAASTTPAAAEDWAQCPACASSQVRYSSSLGRHLLRSVFGSRKRCCLRCGRRWSDAARRARLEEVSFREGWSAFKSLMTSAAVSGAFALVLYVGWSVARARQAVAQLHAHPALAYHYMFIHARDPNSPLAPYRFPLMVLRAPRVSSRFGYRIHPILNSGRFHYGMDFPIRNGTPVFAARDGKVVAAGPAGGYGNRIVVLHPDGESTIYGHLSVIRVKAGDLVRSASTIIGDVGSTGLSTGPHLHFEIHGRNGIPVNPEHLLGL